jgi:hypothetical protein
MSTEDLASADSPVTAAVSSHTPDAAVQDAFVFGWRMAELYDREDLPAPRPPATDAPLPSHLPGASEMSDYEKARLLVDQAQAASRSLAATLGVELPTLDTVIETLRRPGHHSDEVRREIMAAYVEVRDRVAGAAPLAATSCGVGRMLADTSLLPRTGHADLLEERFDPFRLSNAYRWLDDLSAALPPHAAGAVKASLAEWEGWVQSLPRTAGKLRPECLDGAVVRKLRSQGEMWRRLVAGEVAGRSLLRSDDYVAAGERLLQSGRKIAGRFVLRWWPGLLAIAAVTAAALWVAVTYAPSGSPRVAAVLVSVAGALGVSWKTVSATLGKALNQAEALLWESEVIVAIGKAATIHPTAEASTPRPGID